ncbi:riboflavin biosynthesis protein [Geomonas limicola]|uniref:Riboflavin biosynthesis protein n=1 Tax=Geomonas limicola TaxID=2740186 RepID=A0A6V8N446_9BACT|nr:bifunctional riboflavin kinase/FAD synthetase [Geomonas limicola]GFO66754.1 riboflavin biosynthesis protein [Geomonas limicola]
MIIYKSIAEVTEKLRHPVATIGNFDGVHLGHREIFKRVRELARKAGGVSVVITFAPHPLQVLAPERGVKLITSPREKAALIEASGIDYLLEIPFDAAFAALSARQFVERVLVETLGIDHLVIGYDYAFGKGREGDVTLLRELGGRFGYTVELLPAVANGDTVYSSTKVRELVTRGDVKGVVAVLGRHYFITGTVVHGQHRGRGLGFPTANLETEDDLLPEVGVYAVKVRIGTELFDGACNIGSNPTFQNERVTLEVFLFDFDGDLYGMEVSVFFLDRLRGEQRFPNLDALKAAIAADVAHCKEILRDASIIEYHDTE